MGNLGSTRKRGRLCGGLATVIRRTVSCRKSSKLPTGHNFLSRSCCSQRAQWPLVLKGWVMPTEEEEEEASGHRRDAPQDCSGCKVGVFEKVLRPPTALRLHTTGTKSVGEETVMFHAKDRLFLRHLIIISPHAIFTNCKGGVMRQLVTLNSGYLKYARGGRVSRGHFGLRRRWKIISTSTFYTLFQGRNAWFQLLDEVFYLPVLTRSCRSSLQV